jgi:hypothetical protein
MGIGAMCADRLSKRGHDFMSKMHTNEPSDIPIFECKVRRNSSRQSNRRRRAGSQEAARGRPLFGVNGIVCSKDSTGPT